MLLRSSQQVHIRTVTERPSCPLRLALSPGPQGDANDVSLILEDWRTAVALLSKPIRKPQGALIPALSPLALNRFVIC